MQICVGVHSSCPFLGWECGKFKGVFPARARPARRRKKPNRTAAHNSHSAPSSRGAGSPPPASAWSGCLTGRPARPQSAPLSGGGMSGPGRGASANSAGIWGFGGAGGAQKGNRRGYSPEHSQARRGAFFALFAGSGSPPPASARSAPRSPESAQGANSPNALARAPSGQPRTGGAGKALGLIYIAPQTANGESMLWRYANMRELSVFEAVVRGIQGGVCGKTATRPVRAARQ